MHGVCLFCVRPSCVSVHTLSCVNVSISISVYFVAKVYVNVCIYFHHVAYLGLLA